MLLWVASYPRSGNTLLRQVLKRCMGLDSHECLDWNPRSGPGSVGGEQRLAIYQEYWGHRSCSSDPSTFLQEARQSAQLIAVKTHRLPIDDQRAVYVIRDGRLALQSFLKFQTTYHPGVSSFFSLLVGEHVYGGWSRHVDAWLSRPMGQTFLMRFEELAEITNDKLEELAAFLDYQGPITPWRNPQQDLRQLIPEFFGSGSRQWQANDLWSATRVRMFFTLHGDMMQKMGYSSAEEVRQFSLRADDPVEADFLALLTYAQEAATRFHKSTTELQTACDERLELIRQLDAACQERLQIIQRLQTRRMAQSKKRSA